MVILNALIGVILKLTSVYASIFDLVQFIIVLYDLKGRSILDSLIFHFITCSDDNNCFLVEKFGNLFYLISLSIYLMFFYHFDKNFRISLLKIFFINVNNKNINLENSSSCQLKHQNAQSHPFWPNNFFLHPQI